MTRSEKQMPEMEKLCDRNDIVKILDCVEAINNDPAAMGQMLLLAAAVTCVKRQTFLRAADMAYRAIEGFREDFTGTRH
jgi:hypothetical protein